MYLETDDGCWAEPYEQVSAVETREYVRLVFKKNYY
jgi:hypothetical protein